MTELMYGKKLSAEMKLQRVHSSLMQNDRTRPHCAVIMAGKYRIVENKDIPPGMPATAWTDGWNTWYTRAFCEDLNDKELRMVALHEGEHKRWRHLTTWRHLHAQNPRLANIAADHFVNNKLLELDPSEEFIAMPVFTKERIAKLIANGVSKKDAPKVGELMGVRDTKYKGWSVGDIFHDLKKEQQKGGGKGTGQSLDGHDWDGAAQRTEAQEQEIAEQLDRLARQAAIVSRQIGGDWTMDEALDPHVPWETVLMDFMQTHCVGSDYATWNKVNRRSICRGIYMPSGVQDQMGPVLIAVDTSGSISEERKYFLGGITTLCEAARPELVRLLYWGSGVVQDERYTRNEQAAIMQSTEPKDGGGTEPSCITAYMREHSIKPSCVIVFTDGEVGGDWGGDWPAPVIWCIVGNSTVQAGVGRTVHVERV